MNKRLFRTQFNQMENIEKQVLMESLAAGPVKIYAQNCLQAPAE